ncbi:hypothetical protein PsorP6_014731 [Peronosclerospora sorghi]|uniref:Uncharacterized protein n=1 Tax=Peronosclerospora sorghi TaxID=230839 RepID=A0ACC0VUJ1_9STRA|nr:hypothetical protein PsorP6_014731 [Peronosclerospora sorghi]
MMSRQLQEFDSAQRHAERLKLQSATMSLSAAAEHVDADMIILETRRNLHSKTNFLLLLPLKYAAHLFPHCYAFAH